MSPVLDSPTVMAAAAGAAFFAEDAFLLLLERMTSRTTTINRRKAAIQNHFRQRLRLAGGGSAFMGLGAAMALRFRFTGPSMFRPSVSPGSGFASGEVAGCFASG